ncbi:MAG: TIGR03960 family B12-binding radical SAM protein [Candidatus Cloacimonadota bacterium]|nr:TIGR03960 family B12-binding radical SAM protein [Candidatus Cloacimonadota bacterium]
MISTVLGILCQNISNPEKPHLAGVIKTGIRNNVQQVDISNFLYYVKKPGRYSDNELNTKQKRISDKTLNFVLAFPDLYEVGLCHLGLKILYTILNREQKFAADRVYAPDIDLANILRKNNIPLFSIEDKIPINQFDAIGFTLQYELSYTNILMMLELSNIPVFAEERGDDSPLIIAGGPGAFNPEPLSDFFDVFVIGDGEDVILRLANCLLQNKNASKNEKLLKLAQLKGIYIPKFYKQVENYNGCYIVPKTKNVSSKIEKNIFIDFDDPEKIHSPQLVPLVDVIHNRLSVEIMRGCSRGCRFCQAGMIYRPVRERDEKVIEEIVKKEIQLNGWDEISLSSLSSSDYSAIKTLTINLNKFLPKTCTSLSLPSLRIDTFNKNLSKLITNLSGSNLTFAPEAGTQKLRDKINKQINEDDILSSIKSAISFGLRTIKLYFMVGLPFETDNDIVAIVNLIEKIFKLHPYKAVKINVSISAFVPKPFTPFQWCAQDKKENLIQKVRFIKNYFKANKKVRIKYHSIEHSILEAVISRGDRKVGKLIYDAYKNGAIFDAWSEHFEYSRWTKSAQKNNINFENYTGLKEFNKKLCWSHIDCGIKEDFLQKEYERSKEGKTSPDCRHYECQDCGVCLKTPPKYVQNKIVVNSVPPSQKIKNNLPISKFRIFYEKGKALRFFSHRNLLNMIYKIIRRSCLPIYFTKGFRPNPKISLCPPLSLGLIGCNEFFEISLTKKIKEPKILDKLKFNLPKGFRLKKVESLSNFSKKISNFQNELVRVSSKENFNWNDRIVYFKNHSHFIQKKERKINLKEVVSDMKLQQNGVLINKKISGAGVFDILDKVFHYPMDEIDKLKIERIRIF